jgi:hypothetical protein
MSDHKASRLAFFIGEEEPSRQAFRLINSHWLEAEGSDDQSLFVHGSFPTLSQAHVRRYGLLHQKRRLRIRRFQIMIAVACRKVRTSLYRCMPAYCIFRVAEAALYRQRGLRVVDLVPRGNRLAPSKPGDVDL